MRKILIFTFCFIVGLSIVFVAKNIYLQRNQQSPSISKIQKQEKPEFKIWKINSRDYGFYDTATLDNGKAWAVGYDGHDPRRLYFSNDFGETWQYKTFHEFIMLHRVQFIGEQNGWASGNNQVLRTNDGGESWKLTNLKTKAGFDSLNFFNEKIGYVGGGALFADCRGCDFYNIPVEIWKTTDGGKSWKRCFKSGDYYDVFDILSVSETIALAIVDAKIIIRTEDGGKNWKEIVGFPDVQDLALSSDGKIWADGDKGTFYFSEDQGLTWKRPANFPSQLLNYDWNDIKFVDSMRGIAIGSDGKVAITRDGGNSWEEIKADIPTYGKEKDKLIWASFRGDRGIILGGGYFYNFYFPKN